MATFDLATVFAKNRALFGDSRMEGETETPPATGGEGSSEGEAQLGDAGKRAIDAVRAELRAAKALAKTNAEAAAELQTIKDGQRTEAEKAAARIAEAETKVAGVPALVAASLKEHLVELHKISDEDAELFLTATDPAILQKQVNRLVAQGGEQQQKRQKEGNYVPREGGTSTVPASDEKQLARSLFGTP